MREMIQVLIVEDDFRIADINRQFVNRINGFTVLDVVKTGEEALAYLRNNTTLPHLILLDVYIPDVEGLNLFWQLRKEFNEIDIIMITAAKEVATIAETLRGGIFDYIVKPADFVRFEQTLERFSEQRTLLASREELEQEEIDRLTGLQSLPETEASSEEMIPKGIDKFTLEKIKNILRAGGESGVTALNAGNEVGVSRSTARRYLEYLVSIKEAEAQLKYGDIGRPERRYMQWTK
ncbi:response regulator [Bacillus sp. FJAT-29790]|uniref:response regulator n=1 Tax=Bacillus sp. FJAT-29790 TaxID=1895002 RepID=UPI001C24B64C|nr:response regulator [Bacillus sp. FJAT-29790]MBU8881337.1 response regulator [Bacillus sp. FJAT-29790]